MDTKFFGRDVRMRREADGGNGGGAGEQQPTAQAGDVFAAWQAEWSDAQKAAYEGHTAGLKSALQKERDAKDALEKQIRDLSKAADGNSDLQKKLDEMANSLAEAKREVSFVTEAGAKGVTDAKLALLAAKADGLMGEDGKVDWDGLKERHPLLFGKATIPDAGAGAGGNQTPETVSMDDLLRGK